MKHICLFILLFASFTYTAQDQHCATDIVMRRLYEKNPALRLKKQQQDEARNGQAHRTETVGSYTIPIVFHILHVGGVENISDDQVRDAVRILNRDYAKRNADTTEIIPAFKNIADSTKIHFVLATKDPSGNCTTGINHYYDTDTDWDDTSPTIYSHTWNSANYLNVYIVRTITLTGGFGAAGYAYFPGTWQTGDSHDAIVVLNHYFGSIGTGDNFLSRVLTHEVGHWADLYHVFGSSNGAGIDCSDDDYVNDTPTTQGYLSCPNAAVPAQYQLCTPGVSENFQNYMDYSYCCRMFTQQQAQRMQATLQSTVAGRSNICSNANLIATGVINPAGTCLPIADFNYSRSKACVGAPIVFTDATWHSPATAYSWSFPGGTPATATSSAPVITYSTPGIYSVTYSVSNSAGSSSPLTKTNIITITNNTAAYTQTWTEGFESLTVLDADWTLTNSSGSTKWEQTQDAAYAGLYSAKINPTNNTRKTITAMISPAINVSGNFHYLKFKLAAAEVTSNHKNTLNVYVSVNCGTTWQQIYTKTGAALVTSNSNAFNFTPNFNEWRSESANFNLLSTTYTNFKFEYVRDTISGANNIFIDNIYLASAPDVVSIQENTGNLQNLSVFPVPSKGSLDVSFSLLTGQHVNFSVVDIWGRQLESTEETYAAGEHVKTLNTEEKLAPGIYFLRITSGSAVSTHKLIIAE